MNYLPLILGMVVVTYLPRMLPLTLLKNVKLPRSIERFLTVLPAAALGALIVPGVYTAIPESPVIAVVAVCVAGAASLLRGGMIVGVIAGVATAFLLLLV
jgi:branched-subunit amino acid transport protein